MVNSIKVSRATPHRLQLFCLFSRRRLLLDVILVLCPPGCPLWHSSGLACSTGKRPSRPRKGLHGRTAGEIILYIPSGRGGGTGKCWEQGVYFKTFFINTDDLVVFPPSSSLRPGCLMVLRRTAPPPQRSWLARSHSRYSNPPAREHHYKCFSFIHSCKLAPYSHCLNPVGLIKQAALLR